MPTETFFVFRIKFCYLPRTGLRPIHGSWARVCRDVGASVRVFARPYRELILRTDQLQGVQRLELRGDDDDVARALPAGRLLFRIDAQNFPGPVEQSVAGHVQEQLVEHAPRHQRVVRLGEQPAHLRVDAHVLEGLRVLLLETQQLGPERFVQDGVGEALGYL